MKIKSLRMLEKNKIKEKILKIKDWRNPFTIDGKKLKLNDKFNRNWLHDWQVYKSYNLNKIINLSVKLNSTKIINKMSLLEVGCNEGYLSINHLKMGLKSILGIDLKQEAVNRANLIKKYYNLKNIKFLKKNIETLNSKKKYEIVTANGLLYHLSDIIGTIEKISNLTKDILIISTFKHTDINLSRIGLPNFSFTRSSTLRLKVENINLPGNGYKPLVMVPSEKSIVKLIKNNGFKTLIRFYPYPRLKNAPIHDSNFGFYIAFKKKITLKNNFKVQKKFNFFKFEDQLVQL